MYDIICIHYTLLHCNDHNQTMYWCLDYLYFLETKPFAWLCHCHAQPYDITCSNSKALSQPPGEYSFSAVNIHHVLERLQVCTRPKALTDKWFWGWSLCSTLGQLFIPLTVRRMQRTGTESPASELINQTRHEWEINHTKKEEKKNKKKRHMEEERRKLQRYWHIPCSLCWEAAVSNTTSDKQAYCICSSQKLGWQGMWESIIMS